MPFSSDERRAANYIGHIERAATGDTWVGSISGSGGDTLLIEGRIEEMGARKRLVILAKFGRTAEQKKIARDEREAGTGGARNAARRPNPHRGEAR